MKLSITFHGAAGTVTGSRHLMEYEGRQVLLDCGMFQGRRQESRELNLNLPFDASKIEAVVLSHAHIDHSGNLPTLVKHGFKGKVYCTKATADLLRIMLMDSAHIQESDARWLNKKLRRGEKAVEPLYGSKEAERLLELLAPQAYRKEFQVVPGMKCRYLDAGHILGSAISVMDFDRDSDSPYRLVYSGDLGRENLPILKDPEHVDRADALIMESTYGDRLHGEILDSEERLGEIIRRTSARGGKVIIPAFSVGRSQEIVYELSELMTAGDIPEIPIYIDSPLTVKASKIFRAHQECFDDETWEILNEGNDPFGFDRMTYITNVEESKQLNYRHGPCVIISASGMAEAGRILHHLRNNVEDSKNTILIVGYMAEHTLGKRLEMGVSPVKILGNEHTVRAEVKSLHAFSAHADRKDLLGFVHNMEKPPQNIFLVHGEERQTAALADGLREGGTTATIDIPALGDRFELGS